MYKNSYEVPLPMALWLTCDDYLYANHANELSATSLLKSPRYIIGSRRAMYPEQFPEHLRPVVNTNEPIELPDIQSRIAARVGTAIHEAIEKAWKNNYKEGLRLLGYPEDAINKVRINPTESEDNIIPVYQESRLYKEIEVNGMKFTISGQYDMIVNGNLHDIKTTSTYSYESGTNDNKYILQGSIYRWLNPELITGDELTINFLFLDWKQYMDNRNTNYPPAKAYFKKYKLLSIPDTELFIRNKLKQLVEYWEHPLELIPCCTPDELFSSKPVFKYYKNGFTEGTRSTKNFNSFNEASAYRAKNGFKGDIIEHRGKPFMCPYCNPIEVENMMTHTNKLLDLDIG